MLDQSERGVRVLPKVPGLWGKFWAIVNYVYCQTPFLSLNAAAYSHIKNIQLYNVCVCVYQLFPQIEEAMVQPLRESRDRYEELKQIDDAMNEVGGFL